MNKLQIFKVLKIGVLKIDPKFSQIEHIHFKG